ncbi:unnamed protein product, partial [Meganyctiphanes norvegica]
GISEEPPREDLTLLVMQWGQFLDHDLTHTPEYASDDDGDSTNPMECCEFGRMHDSTVEDNCRPINVSTLDDNCRPIDVSNDPIFRGAGRCCMHFVRSLVASKGCLTGSLG